MMGGRSAADTHVLCPHPGSTPPTLQEGFLSSALSQGVEQAKLDTSSGAWWNHQFFILDYMHCVAASSLLSSCMSAALFHTFVLYCGLCRSLLPLGRQDLTSSVAASPRQLTKRLVAHLDSREQAWLARQREQLRLQGWEPSSVPLLGQTAFQARAPSSLSA